MGPARWFAIVFGVAYLLVSLVESFVGSVTVGEATLLERGAAHILIHWATGIVLVVSFFAWEYTAKMVARAVGVIFALVAVVGLLFRGFTGDVLGHVGALPWSYNVIHLATAGVALWAGFTVYSVTREPTRRTTPGRA